MIIRKQILLAACASVVAYLDHTLALVQAK